MRKRIFALLSALALALELASCGSFHDAPGGDARETNGEAGEDAGYVREDAANAGDAGDGGFEGRFPDNVWRADADYGDMEYISYDPADFTPCADAIRALAEEGGETEDFNRADDAAFDELAYVCTLYKLKSNEFYADSSNAALAEESARALEVYRGAEDEYLLALKALASSENRGLMREYYSDAAIGYFADYEPAADSEDEMTGREAELTRRYYALIAEAEPDFDAIGEVFVELVELRRQTARLAGYDSFADYAYQIYYMKDYSPEDAESVWQGAREYFAPLVWRKAGEIADRAGALALDESFDCGVDAVLDALEKGTRELDGEVYEACKYLRDYHLYDLDVSEKKANEGFTTYLDYYCEPFIFNSATGTFYDFQDAFHEFGHFVNYFYEGSSLLFPMPDNDLSELQAQGMNVVMTYLYGDMFDPERADVMRDTALLELAMSVVDGALYDEFQQRVYEEPDLTPERVNEIYAELYVAYGYEPYEGYEREWMDVAHNFTTPFYYISYAVSALGALEINELCREDFEAGRDRYLDVLAMDPEVWYYSEALKKAGLSDIFNTGVCAALADALAETLDSAPEELAAA